jgi:hypothetical protein
MTMICDRTNQQSELAEHQLHDVRGGVALLVRDVPASRPASPPTKPAPILLPHVSVPVCTLGDPPGFSVTGLLGSAG